MLCSNDNNTFTSIKYFIFVLLFLITIFFFYKSQHILKGRDEEKIEKIKNTNKKAFNNNFFEHENILYKNCYLLLGNSNLTIIHFITTRFLIEFNDGIDFKKKLYSEKYIPNGIRVMEKYLFPSLENQSCKNFIWILILGNKANITYIKSLINFNHSFKMKIIYQKDFHNYMRNTTKGFDILITTRIDYDDRIYYDAVNDVRKAINVNKPIILYGYNRGLYYYESNGKYYEFYQDVKDGTHSIFASLIIVLNKVNDTYSIYDAGNHMHLRQNILKSYTRFGITNLDYEPAIFDSGDPKFVYVRQIYSHSMNNYRNMKIQKKNKEIIYFRPNFNIIFI